MLSGEIEQVADIREDKEYDLPVAWTHLPNQRAVIGVPLLRDGRVEGVFVLVRNVPGLFAPREVALLQTVADQAVIAIENVRLFDEVQARTRELTESLEQQTATSEVLSVISRSPSDLQPVMDAIVQTAKRLCEADYALILRRDSTDVYRIVAHSMASTEVFDWMQENPVTAGDGSAIGITAAAKQTVHMPDILADPRFTDFRRQRKTGTRSTLGVPLSQGEQAIGVILLVRTEVRPFNSGQIDLVTNFADQAVIAIANVELFEEVQARTRELAKSLDDLRTAQDRLIQTEKLASLGQLTAGIAHEIKNPLNFVNNFSALSAELVDEMTEVFENPALDEAGRRKELDNIRELLKGNLQRVVQHGRRADSIVKNMLQHSREGSGERRSADINTLVGESLNLAYHGARAEKPGFAITLKHDLYPDAGALELYPQEITRALLNLISNGFYAATKRKGETATGTSSRCSARPPEISVRWSKSAFATTAPASRLT